MIGKRITWLLAAACVLVFWCFGAKVPASQAAEITILFTGDTHAMLYPCSCPVEPDGGIARRAAMVAQFRKLDHELLLLDCGGFIAGGLLDEYTQNTELDKLRTSINLKAMAMMKYDAAAVSADEFNFGRAFLEENIAKANFPLLSADIESSLARPYIIKEIKGIKIALIGLTGGSAVNKAAGFKFIDAKAALKGAVEEVKSKGVDIIVLLSNIEETESMSLAEISGGIDVLIVGRSRRGDEPIIKSDGIILARPSWQGRKLGKLSLTVEAGKITGYKLDEPRLSDRVLDDPDIRKILPDCFQDTNCRKDGVTGKCHDYGLRQAKCSFEESAIVETIVITSKDCKTCDTGIAIATLKKYFPALNVSNLYYPDAKAKNLIKELDIKFLPAYLLSKDVETQKSFPAFRKNLEEKGSFYLLSPQVSGISYFLDRKKITGRLDLFISLYAKDSALVLEELKIRRPELHLLAIKNGYGFDAAAGNLEIEEYLRCVCVQKYYPERFWDYTSCRARNIGSSWWEECAGDFNIDKIKFCARGPEGAKLLEENIALNKELQIMFGPTYLLENQEIFSSRGVTKKEELERIIKK